MSSLETRKIEPQSGTTVTLGEAGDTVNVPSGGIVKTNAVKDAGGNTLFQSDGAGTLSSVNSNLGGAMVFISKHDATGVSSVEITSGIDATYDEYVFYFVNMELTYNGSQIVFSGSTDGGSSYGINKITGVFTNTMLENGSTSFAYESGQDTHNTTAQPISYQQGGNYGDDESLCGEMHLYNPSSTTYVKQFLLQTNFHLSTDGSEQWWTAGFFYTTSAVNAIKFNSVQGNIGRGTIYMYGIK